MYYVKPSVGLNIIDPFRMTWLPQQQWRPVPHDNYWLRLRNAGDISLREDTPPDDEIEGYEAPAPEPKTSEALEGSASA